MSLNQEKEAQLDSSIDPCIAPELQEGLCCSLAQELGGRDGIHSHPPLQREDNLLPADGRLPVGRIPVTKRFKTCYHVNDELNDIQ
jgi:hypothetical protein